jgi:hypothetical protein
MDPLLGNGSINTFQRKEILGKQPIAKEYATREDIHCYAMDVFSVRSDRAPHINKPATV